MNMNKFDTVWNKGLIKKIHLDGIYGSNFSAETADRCSFYNSIENYFGINILQEDSYVNKHENGGYLTQQVKMCEGLWSMEINTTVKDNKININQSLTAIKPSIMQDLVVRFCFDKSSFKLAEISNKTISHENKNIWYQYPVTHLNLTNDTQKLVIRVLESKTSGIFRQEMYVRDEPGYWIVHARFIPIPPYAFYWIRWTNRLFKWSFSHKVSAYLLKIPYIKNRL